MAYSVSFLTGYIFSKTILLLISVLILIRNPMLIIVVMIYFPLVRSGGAGLKAKLVPNSLKNCDTLHISADTKRLLAGAEKLKIKRCLKNGVPVDFCVELSKEFKDFANDGEGFLTKSESERIVFMGLEYIKPHEDGTVPGYPEVKIYRNRATGKFMHNCRVLSVLLQLTLS